MIGQPFAYHEGERPGHIVLRGELGESAAEQIRALVVIDEEVVPNLTFDLSHLSFIWSNAVGELVRAQQAASSAGGSLTLVAAQDSIAARVLSICGVPYESSPAASEDPDADDRPGGAV